MLSKAVLEFDEEVICVALLFTGLFQDNKLMEPPYNFFAAVFARHAIPRPPTLSCFSSGLELFHIRAGKHLLWGSPSPAVLFSLLFSRLEQSSLHKFSMLWVSTTHWNLKEFVWF